ncbi:MAG TPA: hypothetical protein VIS57_12080 [Xanthomonadales bacterium]
MAVVGQNPVDDPPIRILEEATAMFDPQGEEDFTDGCSGLLGQRTAILITQHPASVALANRAVKMQHARVLPGVQFQFKRLAGACAGKR